MVTSATRTVSSLVGGRPVEGSSGGTITVMNPGAARRAGGGGEPRGRGDLRGCVPDRARGPARLGCRAGPRSRPRDPAARPVGGVQPRGPLPPHHARDRQADRGVARRGAGGRRHLQLLPERGSALVRPDRAERDARQTAVHVPQPGRCRRHRDGRQLPGRRAELVPGAGAPVRQRRRVEARRVHAGDGRGVRAAVPARGIRSGRVQHGAGRRRADLRRSRARARPGSRRQGGVHGLHRRRPADRRTDRAAPAVGVSGARREEPARRDARRRPRPRCRGGAVQRVRHGRSALHEPRHRHRAPRRARRVRVEVRRGNARRRDRRPDDRRAVRPHDQRALRRAVPGVARPDPAAPHDVRLDRHRADHRTTTLARASSATPRPASSITRRSWTA